jgi:hypothetical protein
MTLEEAGELFDYWKEHPPAVDLLRIVAQLQGWKPPAPPERGDLADLIAMFPGGIIKGGI